MAAKQRERIQLFYKLSANINSSIRSKKGQSIAKFIFSVFSQLHVAMLCPYLFCQANLAAPTMPAWLPNSAGNSCKLERELGSTRRSISV